MKRIRTGDPGFDELTWGGIPELSTVFIAGPPGAGKTILANQIAFSIAEGGEKALIISTLSEPLTKMIRFMCGFSFFKAELIGKAIFFEDVSELVRRGDTEGILDLIEERVRELKPKVLIVDSVRSLLDAVTGGRDRKRDFIHRIAVRFPVWGTTALLVGEYLLDEIGREPEFSVADGIVYLFGTEEEELQKRFVQIIKLRGSPFLRGKQYFEIGSEGLRVFPRLRPEVESISYPLCEDRIPTGVEGLDALLGGGVRKFTTTLLTGPTGSGKTVMALSFAGAFLRKEREKGFVYFTFEESPEALRYYARRLGIELEGFIAEGRLEFRFISPVELDLDLLASRIVEGVRELDSECGVVLDSITSFRFSHRDDVRYREFLWSVANFFRFNRNTSFLILETEDPFRGTPVADDLRLSILSDNVILLRYYQRDGSVRRAVEVLKVRGEEHARDIHELEIVSGRGAVVGKRIEGRFLR